MHTLGAGGVRRSSVAYYNTAGEARRGGEALDVRYVAVSVAISVEGLHDVPCCAVKSRASRGLGGEKG